MKKYYEAYDERYQTIHQMGYCWASEAVTPIIAEIIKKYGIGPAAPILEIGCGEGMDALALLRGGFDLLATDVSPEAVSFCRKHAPEYADRFQVMDCLKSEDKSHYSFIYSIAVIHMLLLEEDRNGFYRFIREHLTKDGIALICTMGDGDSEITTDMKNAFVLQERDHPAGKVMVAGTSLRMVSFPRFEAELANNELTILEKGMTSRLPDFNQLMYAVVKA